MRRTQDRAESAVSRLVGDDDFTMLRAGRVTTDRARLWLRAPSELREPSLSLSLCTSDGRIVHEGEIDPAMQEDGDGTGIVELGGEAGPLRPDTAYIAMVTAANGAEIGRCRFRTAPVDRSERFSIAVASCHHPFDDAGTLDLKAVGFVRSLPAALRDRATSRVLWMGDQMYTDEPPALSLFAPGPFAAVGPPGRDDVLDCSREEIRRLLHGRYRASFDTPGFRGLAGGFASGAICDDHELVDNFGSDPAHHEDPRWVTFKQGALDAFFDYQGSLVHAHRPEASDFAMRYGQLDAVVLDLRSERRATADAIEILSDAQLARLRETLRDSSDQDVVIVGLSVAIYHLPDWAAAVGSAVVGPGSNLADRWSHPRAAQSRRALLDTLHEHQRRHPRQRIVIVSGDVHVGAISELRWRDPSLPPMLQLTASALSNRRPDVELAASAAAPRIANIPEGDGPLARVELVEPGPGEANPFMGLNLGLVEVRSEPGGRSAVRLTLLGEDEATAHPVLSSPWYPPPEPDREPLPAT